ncbi:MAG: hypothetical protein NTZ74_16705 [Chloroflexi bacterium]|nr:hypothetical protein [Chloroflexota bacterium]
MNTGMLWFDNDPKIDLNSKIMKASAYYQKKYGQAPNLCFVNPCMTVEIPLKSCGVEVQPNQTILPNHFWLGVKQPSVTA